MADRVVLQGAVVPRIVLALPAFAIGVGGGAAGALHSNSPLKWVGSAALLVAGAVVTLRILTAGFVISDSGVRVRAVWRTWTVPWSKVYHVTIASVSSRSLSGPSGTLELATTDGARLRTRALTTAKPTSPRLVAALTTIQGARDRWQSTNSNATTPCKGDGAARNAQFRAYWWPSPSQAAAGETWPQITVRVSPGQATLHLAFGYTEHLQPVSLTGPVADAAPDDVIFHVTTTTGTQGQLRTTRTDATLLETELGWSTQTNHPNE